MYLHHPCARDARLAAVASPSAEHTVRGHVTVAHTQQSTPLTAAKQKIQQLGHYQATPQVSDTVVC